MKASILCLLTLLAPVLAAQGHDHHALAASPPAPAGDVRSLDVCAADGRLHVLYAEADPTSPGAPIFYQHSTDDGVTWSEPTRVDSGGPPPLARGRGTDFQLAVHGDSLTAIWLTAGSGFGGRGPLASAYSSDGGVSWNPGPSPADDGTDGDHAFIDVAFSPDGAAHAVWLDTRTGPAPGKGLMAATSPDGGRTWLPNTVIDARSCECCWNTLRSDRAGKLYCLYRDLDPRDMALAVSEDSGSTWRRTSTVGAFQWDFDGCPHAGGGLAIDDTRTIPVAHVLVWTGKTDQAGLYYLHSTKRTLDTWNPPHQLGTDRAAQADLAQTAEGTLAAVWVDFRDGAMQVWLSRSTNGGDDWEPPEALTPPDKSYPDHPRILAQGNALHVFWTTRAEGRTVWRHRCIAPTQSVHSR